MTMQSIIMILLGCILAGSTFTSAISFSRPVARKRSDLNDDGEELLQALEFLERYDGERRPSNLDNRINSNYGLFEDDNDDYDDLIIPYDPSLSQNRVDMNGLPPPPWTPNAESRDIYDMGFNEAFNNKPEETRSRMTIGERVEENSDFNHLLDRLVEDAIMEDMLREDAAEAAEIIEGDMADDDAAFSSYNSEPETYGGNYDMNAPAFTSEDDYGGLDESSYEALDSFDDAAENQDHIDKDLLEAVILRLAEGEMKHRILEEKQETEMTKDDDYDDVEEFNSSYEYIPDEDLDTEEDIDNFVENIMAELMEGSQDLADKLINEIDNEKDILEEEDMLEEEELQGPYGDVVFSDGWDTPSFESDDVTCPALAFILDDCLVVDDFPGLGDGGYKEGFGESCNRHQLCYFCTGTFDIPIKLCDETFKMELMSICKDDTECDFRAKYFWLSAISSRVPSPMDLSVCKEPCVMGYLLDK